MKNPCNNCEHVLKDLESELFEPRCNNGCEQFSKYANDMSSQLDAMLELGAQILNKHGVTLD